MEAMKYVIRSADPYSKNRTRALVNTRYLTIVLHQGCSLEEGEGLWTATVKILTGKVWLSAHKKSDYLRTKSLVICAQKK
jgi:hypothetical protein